jgi:hypothetical protein
MWIGRLGKSAACANAALATTSPTAAIIRLAIFRTISPYQASGIKYQVSV